MDDKEQSPIGSGFWGFASALSASIKQQTAEVSDSFQRTSWVNELTSLADGFGSERAGLAQRAQDVSNRIGQVVPEKAGRKRDVLK